MKKCLALLVVAVMVVSSVGVFATDISEGMGLPDWAIEVAPGIWTACMRPERLTNPEFLCDCCDNSGNVTRAEFARIIIGMKGLTGIVHQVETGFYDVPMEHSKSGYVRLAHQMGVIQGAGGYFRPDDRIVIDEALTMLVRALGYSPMAEARGGFPMGYFTVAEITELIEEFAHLDGVPFMLNGFATRNFLTTLVNRALDVPMMMQIIFPAESADPPISAFAILDVKYVL